MRSAEMLAFYCKGQQHRPREPRSASPPGPGPQQGRADPMLIRELAVSRRTCPCGLEQDCSHHWLEPRRNGRRFTLRSSLQSTRPWPWPWVREAVAQEAPPDLAPVLGESGEEQSARRPGLGSGEAAGQDDGRGDWTLRKVPGVFLACANTGRSACVALRVLLPSAT